MIDKLNILSKAPHPGQRTIEDGRSRAWLITENEIIANIRNFKTPVALVTLTLLLLLSAHVLALDYRQRLNNWSANQDHQRDAVIGGSIKYDLANGSFFHRAVIGRIAPMQRPQQFSAVIKGMDGEVDRTVSVSQRIVFGARQDEPLASAIIDSPDTSFIIKLLVSLFALMFSLDAVTREKEVGILRVMLAQPIRRRELIQCKALGASISLLAAFGIAYASEIIYLYLVHGLLSNLEDMARASLIFGLGALYGVVFVHIGLFISTITARTKTAVTMGLLTWITIVLVLPNASVLMAKLLTPTPSYNQLNARMYEARQRILQKDSEDNPTTRSSPEQPVLDQTLLRLFETERLMTDNYLASKKDQNYQAKLLAALSPAGALSFGLSDLAGTGVSAYSSYLDLLRSGRDIMLNALKRRLDLPPQDGNKLVQEAGEMITNIQRRTEPLGAGIRSSVISITSLLAWAIIFGMATCRQFERYDVR
jgi:ABC-type transport system involved in multi-copper enzyme maturation permease subunit